MDCQKCRGGDRTVPPTLPAKHPNLGTGVSGRTVDPTAQTQSKLTHGPFAERNLGCPTPRGPSVRARRSGPLLLLTVSAIRGPLRLHRVRRPTILSGERGPPAEGFRPVQPLHLCGSV